MRGTEISNGSGGATTRASEWQTSRRTDPSVVDEDEVHNPYTFVVDGEEPDPAK
jgi:hypothetical protein